MKILKRSGDCDRDKPGEQYASHEESVSRIKDINTVKLSREVKTVD